MVLFPAIANKSFTVFRCRSIPGLDFDVLDEDFSVKCWTGEHSTFIIIAVISIGVCKSVFVVLVCYTHIHVPGIACTLPCFRFFCCHISQMPLVCRWWSFLICTAIVNICTTKMHTSMNGSMQDSAHFLLNLNHNSGMGGW